MLYLLVVPSIVLGQEALDLLGKERYVFSWNIEVFLKMKLDTAVSISNETIFQNNIPLVRSSRPSLFNCV